MQTIKVTRGNGYLGIKAGRHGTVLTGQLEDGQDVAVQFIFGYTLHFRVSRPTGAAEFLLRARTARVDLLVTEVRQ